jgi:hypothetical protein
MDIDSHIMDRLLFHRSRSFPALGDRELFGRQRERGLYIR